MLVLHKNFISTRKFGVEYELTASVSKKELGIYLKDFETENGTNRFVHVEGGEKGWAESYANDFWHVKYDSTCGPLGKKKDFGWEIASYIGSGNKDIVSISKAASYLRNRGVLTNNNCGLHIHADVSDLTVEQMGTLLSHWISIEHIIVQSCPKRRKNNKFCKSLARKIANVKKHIHTPSVLWDYIKPDNFSPHENPQKKVTLNSLGFAAGLVNKFHLRKTLELRMPECVLDEDFVANWIRLYLNFIDVNIKRGMANISKNCNNLSDLMWTLGLEDKESFMLLSQEMHDVKVWFLNRLMENGNQQKMIKAVAKKLDLITRI